MKWLRKVWQKINGNKTKIGTALVLAGKVLQKVGVAEGAAVEQIGTVIASIGLGHVATKALEAPEVSPADTSWVPGVTPPPPSGR